MLHLNFDAPTLASSFWNLFFSCLEFEIKLSRLSNFFKVYNSYFIAAGENVHFMIKLHFISNRASWTVLDSGTTSAWDLFVLFFSVLSTSICVLSQMAQQGFFAAIYSYHLMLRRRESNPRPSVELHQTGTFEGHSTDWATVPRLVLEVAWKNGSAYLWAFIGCALSV